MIILYICATDILNRDTDAMVLKEYIRRYAGYVTPCNTLDRNMRHEPYWQKSSQGLMPRQSQRLLCWLFLKKEGNFLD